MAEAAPKAELLKLNLGCGTNRHEGYVNVDKYGVCQPDVQMDLEHFPWPWEDNSVGEVLLNHVLEHLGGSGETYKRIWQEIYRVCAPGAKVFIVVPHPRHQNFLGDPTHVRAIHWLQFTLFSKQNCAQWEKAQAANSQLARYWGIDFEIRAMELSPDMEKWQKFRDERDRTVENLAFDSETLNGVCAEIRVTLEAIK